MVKVLNIICQINKKKHHKKLHNKHKHINYHIMIQFHKQNLKEYHQFKDIINKTISLIQISNQANF